MQVIQKIKQFLLHRSLISGSSDPGSGNRLRCSRNTYIKNQRNIRIIGSVSLILLFALTVFTLRPVSVSTDFAEATANPATTTLTMTTGYASASLDITPSSTSGTFASSSDDELAKFNVSTNNITGYNLSISHASATTPAPLTSEDLSENLDSLPTGTSITESQFNSTEYVGRYGFKPSKLNSQSNSNYIPAPTTSSTTLNKTTRANTTSDSYTIALGANIDYTKSAGTYTNTFILTAVANNVPYTINYKDTSGSSVSNLPTTESASTATASKFILSSTVPTRTGYTFNKWCDGTVTHKATGNDTCSGNTYSAGSTYSFASPSSTSTNVANLYAMWNVKTFAITLAKTNATAIKIDGTSYTGSSATLTYGNHTISGTYPSDYEFSSWATSNSTNLAITSTSSASTTITVHGAAKLTLTGKNSKIYMQDMIANQCTTTAKTVYDARDGSAYKVQKLADGRCWLLDNLRLGSADFASGVTELNSTNTNTTNSIATSTFTGWDTTSGSWSYDTPMINTTWANTPTTGYGSGSSKIGVYYNYCAATMQSYCMAEGSGDGNATQDVCPKGWRMPTGGSFGEYQALCNAVKGSACGSEDRSADALKLREALSTPLSGSFNFSYSIAYDQGRGGDFWSSTRYDSKSVHILIVTSSYVGLHYDDRTDGIPVRCVLKEPIESVTYMQDITSEMVANTHVGTTATLIDKRDNQSYLVGKLADGRLWMLDNLRLGSADFASGVTTLDSTNTNTTKSIATSTLTDWNTTSGFNSYTIPMINTASANNTATGYGFGSKKVGVYYNYCAATMQSYCMAAGSDSGNATQDVCPKGWRMPTGGSSGEYQALYTAYSSSVWNFNNALSTSLSGYFYDSSVSYRGSYGYFWSSMHNNGNYMHSLYVNDSSVSPQDSHDRSYGFSVRCVLKGTQTIADATYMQDVVTLEMQADTPVGTTATLIDKRDNQSYLVGKLADGKLWMLDNLRLGSADFASGVTYLNSTNTNTTNSISTSTFNGWKKTGFNSMTTPMINTASANTINSDSSLNWGNGSHKYGVYYNYCAATMQSYCMTSGSDNASQDVCPKGWRMPTGGYNGEYQALYTAYSSNATNFREALSTPLSGQLHLSSATNRGSYGYFWSSTHNDSYDMYYLGVSSSDVGQNADVRYNGLSVRCVLK